MFARALAENQAYEKAHAFRIPSSAFPSLDRIASRNRATAKLQEFKAARTKKIKDKNGS